MTIVNEIEQASDYLRSVSETNHDLVVVWGNVLNDVEVHHMHRQGNLLLCLDTTITFETNIFEKSGQIALDDAVLRGYPLFVRRRYIKDYFLENTSDNSDQ